MLLLLLGIIVLHVAVLVLLFVSTIVSVSVWPGSTRGWGARSSPRAWPPDHDFRHAPSSLQIASLRHPWAFCSFWQSVPFQ